jgi:hypothetical protein
MRREESGRTLRVSPTLLAGVLSVPVPPVTAVVLPEEAMVADRVDRNVFG